MLAGFHRGGSPARYVTVCPCCTALMDRRPRSPLMKLLPGSRFYRCDACGTRMLTVFGLCFKRI